MKSLLNEKNTDEDEQRTEIKIEYTVDPNDCSVESETPEHTRIIESNHESECKETELNITGEFIESKAVLQQDVMQNNDLAENIDIFKSVKFCCEECGDCFILKSNFKQHMMRKHEVPACDLEKYILRSTIQVTKMADLEITEENIILQCDTCNEKFKTCAEIEEHYKSHKRYVCEHCGAGFLKKSYLNDHSEIHTTEKRHVCPICGKAFRRRTVLVKHKKIHTHPRQCVCEICGLRFTDKGTLNTHIKLKHIKERNFNCTICGLWFPLKSTLMKHTYRHNEDRKREHVCTMCHMAYKDKSSLNRHIIIKHTENAAKPSCSYCGKRYTTNTNLLKHVRKHHKSSHVKKQLDDINE